MTITTQGPAWMRILGGVLLVSFAGMVVLTVLLVGAIGALSAVVTMLPAVLVLAVGLLLVSAAVHVRVGEVLELRFVPIWRRRLVYSELESIDVVQQSWFRFGGVGLRRSGHAVGLILGNRPALRVQARGGREYVVQCEDPAPVAECIRARMLPG